MITTATTMPKIAESRQRHPAAAAADPRRTQTLTPSATRHPRPPHTAAPRPRSRPATARCDSVSGARPARNVAAASARRSPWEAFCPPRAE